VVTKRLAKPVEPDDVLLILTRRAKHGDAEAQEQLATQMGDATTPVGRQLAIAAVLHKATLRAGQDDAEQGRR
jgi:hypothetical protein